MNNLKIARAGLLLGMAAPFGAIALPAAPAAAQQVVDQTLSDLRVDQVGGCATITVNFNIRVQLVSHFPESSGRELHIRLQPLDAATHGKESLRTPDSVPELSALEFDGDDPAGPVLSLVFNRNVQFAVSANDRPQSVSIRLVGACAGAAPVASATGVVKAAHALPALAAPTGLYVLNLLSSRTAPGDLDAAQAGALAGRVVYQNDAERDGQVWHRLRLGFYDTREAAEADRAKLAALFPEAWTLKVSPDERDEGIANRRDTGAAVVATSAGHGTEADRAEAARLTTAAEGAIKAGTIDLAIQLLTNAVALPENAATPRALELLGLTYERKGQIAHAQAEYERYLQRFPSGEAAVRVRQRLASLGAGSPSQTLRSVSGGRGKDWTWASRGSFSQFYFRDQSNITTIDATAPKPNTETPLLNLNELLTAADLTITGGNDRSQLQLRAAGSYAKDFGTSGNSHDIKSLTALYFDYSSRDTGLSARLGRQTRNSDGILGRFDGAFLSWQFQPTVRVNVAGGFPVIDSHQMFVQDKRPFYGISVDLGARRAALQSTIYWFDQRTVGGFVDRQSIGIEERYLKRNFNAYLMLDYDVHFKVINLGLLTFNYMFPDKSNLGVTVDYRRTPLLTTHNILNGMIDLNNLPVFDLRALRPFFTDSQIYQYAFGNTILMKTVTATYSRPIGSKLQLNFDVTGTDTGGTTGVPASAGTQWILSIPATGREFYYGTQLVGSGLLWSNDIYILSARYADSYGGHTWTLDFNARVPLSQKLRISPRVRYGERTYLPTPTSSVIAGTYRQFQPTLQLNWYPMRHSEVEINAGGNFTRQVQLTGGAFPSNTTVTEKGIVITAGYRLDF